MFWESHSVFADEVLKYVERKGIFLSEITPLFTAVQTT